MNHQLYCLPKKRIHKEEIRNTATVPNREVTIQKSNDQPGDGVEPDVDDFIVLGRELIMNFVKRFEKRLCPHMASGGSNNPFVTRTVFKAVSIVIVFWSSKCTLSQTLSKRCPSIYDSMHERNRAWVDAIKTYERYIEEFAADDSYPFEDHEDAPGIPDLQASVGR